MEDKEVDDQIEDGMGFAGHAPERRESPQGVKTFGRDLKAISAKLMKDLSEIEGLTPEEISRRGRAALEQMTASSYALAEREIIRDALKWVLRNRLVTRRGPVGEILGLQTPMPGNLGKMVAPPPPYAHVIEEVLAEINLAAVHAG
jgi:hypothetical protein